jgi:Mrp family chromosome partitioning ATPase
MNRIEEAIQKAKLARARESALAAEARREADPAQPRPDGLGAHDRVGQDRSLHDRAAHEWNAHDRAAHERAVQERATEERAYVERTGTERSLHGVGASDLRTASPIGRALTVDRESLNREGILPAAADAHRLADEFRVAKRAVLAQLGRTRAVSSGRRVIAVASALPGEGKTFSSYHLAMSFAMERDLNVLLIDGDVARPTLSRAFGCSECHGLLDFLDADVGSVDEIFYRTDHERLWFAPAGAPRPHAAELLTSPRMPVLLDALAQRIGHLLIVMDTPPLLPTVESRALTDLADQTLLVVKANATPQGAILQALEQIGQGRAVQLLLNQRRESKLDAYYYQQYPAYPGANVMPAARAD